MAESNGIWLKVRTKGNASPKGKSRVYFSCHPDDFDKYFEDVCEQIFRTQDCAIYYTEDMNASYSDENWENDLGQMNLFVMPVTFKLLSGGNRSLDTDLSFAQKMHIPILPLSMESGLVELFTEKFGKLQYLSPYEKDETAISYEEKLKSFLESVLIGTEMRKRVQAAFDAYIFLSYRKKDRKYANELMRLIHKNPLYRDIAIWYDEFLTPGEEYSDNIEEALSKSSLFSLLVTPNLLEKTNYVMTTEYPAACEKGKKILPVEMIDTEYKSLTEQYPNLPVMVKGCDDSAFRERLKKEMENIAREENDEDPIHNYLIGLAYLEGIDVEKDSECAVELITMAAEADLPEAMEKLAEMYYDGLAVERDWIKWVEWLEKIMAWAEKAYAEDEEQLAEKRSDLAYGYSKIGRFSEALTLYEKVYDVRKRVHGEGHWSTLITLRDMARIYKDIGEYNHSLELYQKVLRRRVEGEGHTSTLTTLNNMAILYGKLGNHEHELELHQKIYEIKKRVKGEEHPDTMCTLHNMACCYLELGDYSRALELHQKVYETLKQVLGEEHPNTLIVLNSIAIDCGNLGDYNHALELFQMTYDIRKRVLGEEHPATLGTMKNLAVAYVYLGEYIHALALFQLTYDIRKRVLGECHPDTIETLRNMAVCYGKQGNRKRESELFQKIDEIQKQMPGEERRETIPGNNNDVSTTTDDNDVSDSSNKQVVLEEGSFWEDIAIKEVKLGRDRDTFTMGALPGYAMFNSVIDNPVVGDERNFVRVREIGSGETYSDEVEVIPGKEYEVYILIHNDAASDTNLEENIVATNVRLASAYPTIINSDKRGMISGLLSWRFVKPDSLNKTYEATIWDEAYLISKTDGVVIRYKTGTAMIHNYGKTGGSVLSTALFTEEGTPLGYDHLEGSISGGVAHASYVTYTLICEKITSLTSFLVSTNGENFSNSIEAKPGETLTLHGEFNNAGNVELSNVIFKDIHEEGICIVSNTTKIFDINNVKGKTIAEIIDTSGYNVGNVAPGALVQIIYQIQVLDDKELIGKIIEDSLSIRYNSEDQGSYSVKIKVIGK